MGQVVFWSRRFKNDILYFSKLTILYRFINTYFVQPLKYFENIQTSNILYFLAILYK